MELMKAFMQGAGGLSPEFWAVLSVLPLLGMAVSASDQVYQHVGNGVGSGDDGGYGPEADVERRKPWFRLLPYLVIEFVMLTFHEMGLSMVIDFWMDAYVADAPVIGWIVEFFAPDLMFGELIIFIMGCFIVSAPVLLASVALDTPAVKFGWAGIKKDPVAKYTLGIPACLYLVAIGTEAYGLYYRVLAEQVEQPIKDVVGFDPSIPLILIVAFITLAITSVAGFFTAKAIHQIKAGD